MLQYYQIYQTILIVLLIFFSARFVESNSLLHRMCSRSKAVELSISCALFRLAEKRRYNALHLRHFPLPEGEMFHAILLVDNNQTLRHVHPINVKHRNIPAVWESNAMTFDHDRLYCLLKNGESMCVG